MKNFKLQFLETLMLITAIILQAQLVLAQVPAKLDHQYDCYELRAENSQLIASIKLDQNKDIAFLSNNQSEGQGSYELNNFYKCGSSGTCGTAELTVSILPNNSAFGILRIQLMVLDDYAIGTLIEFGKSGQSELMCFASKLLD